MKVFACCRALDEQRHIEKFCQSYQNIADTILVADGGSSDNTVLLAEQISRVKVIHYDNKVECRNGIFRNPDGPHIQFLVDSARDMGADWIIFQDTDMRPNKYLKDHGRELFAYMDEEKKDFLLLTQIFLWQNDWYFPNMSKQGNRWMQGLWAWRANINLKIIDKMPHFEFSYDGQHSIDINKTGRQLAIQPPACYLHYGWESKEMTDEHVEYYKKSGLIPGMIHPLLIGGRQEYKEEWMVE